MAITLKFPDGTEATGTAKELFEYRNYLMGAQQMGAAALPVASKAPWPSPTPVVQPSGAKPLFSHTTGRVNPAQDDTPLKFLKAIRDHSNSGGLTGEELMPVLGLSHPKGVGSRATVINKAIERLGFKNLDEVYTRSRDSGGQRRWRAGPRIDEVIAMLDKGKEMPPLDDEL